MLTCLEADPILIAIITTTKKYGESNHFTKFNGVKTNGMDFKVTCTCKTERVQASLHER
jgi:hypothetical protein